VRDPRRWTIHWNEIEKFKMKKMHLLSAIGSLAIFSIGAVAVLAAYGAHSTQRGLAVDIAEGNDPLPATPSDRVNADQPRAGQAASQSTIMRSTMTVEANIPPTEDNETLRTSTAAELNESSAAVTMTAEMIRASNWDQADPGELAIDRIPRCHVRFLDPSHNLRGRIVVPGKDEDTLFFEDHYRLSLIQRGRAVRAVRVMPNGTFSFEGLENGPYGLLLEGRQTMLTYSIYLADRSDLQAAGLPDDEIERIFRSQNSRADELQLSYRSCCTLREDYPTIRRLVDEWRRAAPTQELSQKYRRNQLYIPENLNLSKSVPGTSLCGHQVHLLPTGELLGRTRKIVFLQEARKYSVVLAENVDVYVIRGNQVIAQAKTDEDGGFLVENLEPGVYSIVAHATAPRSDESRQANDPVDEPHYDYFGVIGIEAVAWPRQNGVPEFPMANQDQLADSGLVAFRQDENAANQETPLFLDLGLSELPPEAPEEETPFEPAPMAGGMGGGGFGGGLGGFIPGFLLGLTPFLLDDDDSSPFRP
jgi:hypothetical protein